ncbi:MAG: bifunctional phosphoribosyl-AMP cyclohydrolase/phosphoribosyl-ATP diphosphatase HisIE [Candidatus Wallbacteria bacterium]|nr:bifunctional phosphoribosyl-AMP cyclohydrolase/phosphoribosyl-ATP diphosphatase HisIE [Candidatus Wallbacteria bacterium]
MIIPSIDLMSGKAVQLRQGREKVLERDNPLSLAREFDRVAEIGLIDLDAALSQGDNEKLIREICGFAECRVGGGIRDLEKAQRILSYGATRIIIGSRAFDQDRINHAFLAQLCEKIGKSRIMLAIDSREGRIATCGWKHDTGIEVLSAVRELERYCDEFLFTCVEREGGMQGTDHELVSELMGLTKNRITVAGGVHTTEEAVRLVRSGCCVQLGMALYTGKIDLNDAFVRSLDWEKSGGLIPTITCDEHGQMLMLAYSNEESLRRMFETGRGCYFSRSRGKLWEKGETSGHIQEFMRIRTDCDRDALLLTVRQHGPACHTGSYSCFGAKKFTHSGLYRVIEDRFKNPRPGSYTATLTKELVREKMMEEAQEVVEAVTRDELVWEAADVLYFLTVLIAKEGITLDEVLNELRRRSK